MSLCYTFRYLFDWGFSLNSFMTEVVIIWTGFYMITASVMKELSSLIFASNYSIVDYELNSEFSVIFSVFLWFCQLEFALSNWDIEFKYARDP